jgi:glycosyltransferase involved in cell wall biosynthesis/2-polyprenyl-3-methyl-5-hydroxy-6-metoxy-1,4-benzoquinol methylase
MDVVIHCLGMPFNGETVTKQSLGGSESAAYYQARELAKRGHRVTVFTSSTEEGVWDDVRYCYTGEPQQGAVLGDRFEFYARNTPHDVLIIQRHPMAFHGAFTSKVNIWQLHDLALHRTNGIANHNMWQVDAVTCVSEWHKKQVCSVYGFDPDFVQVVPNGVDESLYQCKTSIKHAKEGEWGYLSGGGYLAIDGISTQIPIPGEGRFVMLYQSRPERGLEHLVRPGGIMDRLRDTNAHLLVCTYNNHPPQMAGYYNHLAQCAEALPNVTMIGSLSKPQLAALQKSCDLLVYPTEFEEVSCITAMEAMHAGLPMLASDVGALAETCAGAGVKLVPLKDGRAEEDEFVDYIGVHAPVKTFSLEKHQQLESAKTRRWSDAVDRLESVIEQCFERRKGTEAAAIRHCIEHSDIDFAVGPVATGVANAIVERTVHEMDALYQFTRSPAAYKAHYDKHGGKYYDDFEDQVIGEDVTRSQRFMGVAQFVQQESMIAGDEIRVLDYGCAHGHYIMPLAKAFPNARFVGVDVNDRAVAAAVKWAMRDGVANAEFCLGGQDVFDNPGMLTPLAYDETSMQFEGNAAVAKQAHRELFDVVIAGEVVEHVPDWMDLLERFRSVLKPGGLLIITTPAGRWEWQGTEAFRDAREHLHHFERHDIVEICGNNPVEILYAPAGQDRTGKGLGSWIWGVRPNEPFRMYDVERKRKLLAPRETLSACMIVKDGEKTLRKSVDSFIDWVDEIIIAVDPTTKDRTFDVIDQLRQDYRWKPITLINGLPALEAGFDEARNRSIEQACGDWILWVDADEEVRNPWNLWKYLRPSQHNAYGFPQVHYSSDPDQVLTTDFPCRLFRARKGIKFFGVVHEHPEIEVGKAIPRSALRHDVKFLHNGYVDEEVRRKRYMRNLPLLHRDLQKYPERGLNRFLMLRDIAQGLMFEHEQTQGVVLHGQKERAQEGINMWRMMVEKDPLRMVMDSLQFYSHCVATLGMGFDAEVTYRVAKEIAPDLACNTNFKGRFATQDDYSKLIRKIEQEATRHYDSKYL